VRQLLRSKKIAYVIAEPEDQKANRKRKGSKGGRPISFDLLAYKERNQVERCFNRLKQWRGLATRTDKHGHNYAVGLLLASAVMWAK
jgi:transposase